jgi:two-component system KDP operon response regulator KdpE
MSQGSLVLVVDDEIQIRRFLRISLEGNGYRVEEAVNGHDALQRTAQLHPDAIILDLGLPDMDGNAVLQRLREWTATPVIILSVRDADAEKIRALDAGADDYLTKPFSTGELLARLRVAERHARPQEAQAVYHVGQFTVDLTRRLVTIEDEPVKLTPTEYALVRLFLQHADRVLTHRQILREVWGPEYVNETHYLRVYMAQLRQKLEINPTRPKVFVTEPGVGYRLVTGA